MEKKYLSEITYITDTIIEKISEHQYWKNYINKFKEHTKYYNWNYKEQNYKISIVTGEDTGPNTHLEYGG